MRRRSDIDYLLLVHPLLQVVYFESSISPYTGKRRLMSVCKSGQGLRYRLPCPGNPIVDGIGEGKPENQQVCGCVCRRGWPCCSCLSPVPRVMPSPAC